MKYIKLVALSGLLSLFIISCGGKKSKLGKIIPKNASVVVVMDAKSILSKLPWEEIKQTTWYNEVISDTSMPATSKAFLADPSKTGIDMNAPIVSFMLNGENSLHVMEASIKDSKAYGEFIKTIHPDVMISKDGDVNIFKTKEVAGQWNDDRVVFVASSRSHMPRNMMNDSLFNKDSIFTEAIPLPSPDSLLGVSKMVFNLSEENSLYSNERFAQLEKEDGDIHLWMNIDELTKGQMGKNAGMMGMMKFDKFLVDNYTTMTVNFENGKITAKHKQYFGKELSDILKEGEGDINTDMIKRLPQQNIAGVYAMHFTPANLLKIIKLTGLDGFINIFMSQKGMTLDDVIKATKGDIVFSVGDIKMINDTTNLKGIDTDKYPIKPTATFLFSIAIGDKDAFNKMLGMGNEMQKDMGKKNIFQKKDDKYFAVSNSQEAVNKYFSASNADPVFLGDIKDHSSAGYVDIQMILKAMQPEFTKDSSTTGKGYYNLNAAMWNTALFTGGEYKDGGIVNNAELNLLDKNTNSLKQLNKFMDQMFILHKEEKKKKSEKMNADSTNVKKDIVPQVKKKPAKKK